MIEALHDPVSRCEETRDSGLRCHLLAGHLSAHATRSGGAIISWHNWHADKAGHTLALDWYDEERLDSSG